MYIIITTETIATYQNLIYPSCNVEGFETTLSLRLVSISIGFDTTLTLLN